MRKRTLASWTAAVVAGVVFTIACGGGDDNQRRLSSRGEACQSSDDCADGLSCVAIFSGASSGSTVVVGSGGGICETSQFKVAETQKECVALQCLQAADCCPTPPAECAQLQAECGDAGNGVGSPSACSEYDELCKCDITTFACTNGACSHICNADEQCNGEKCSGGRCVQCIDNTSCQTGYNCIDGSCEAPCAGDGDCPGFQRCTAGQCVDSGCQTDRECVAWTKHVDATCGTDGKCITPCQTDLECGSPVNFGFKACINHQCVDLGCSTDKDCELSYSGDGGGGYNGHPVHYQCRDKATAAPK